MSEKTILAVASGGGHWQQLQLLTPAFADHDLVLATTLAGCEPGIHRIPECSRDSIGSVLLSFWSIMKLVISTRPDVVVSTGALPGLLALVLGKLLGARTIWIDSIANAEQMSLSGRLARRIAALCLTQWPEVAQRSGAQYAGAVL